MLASTKFWRHSAEPMATKPKKASHAKERAVAPIDEMSAPSCAALDHPLKADIEARPEADPRRQSRDR